MVPSEAVTNSFLQQRTSKNGSNDIHTHMHTYFGKNTASSEQSHAYLERFTRPNYASKSLKCTLEVE